MTDILSITAATPKLRSDLVLSRQGDAVVVKDPVTGRFYRFRHVEEFILQQLDGATSLDAVRCRVEAHFGAALSAQTLERFNERLHNLGLLEVPGQTMRPLGRVQGDPLYLRLRAFDPDKLLGWLANRLGFCFTKSFLACSVGLLLLAGIVTATNWLQITGESVRLYQWPGVLFAYVTVLAVIAVHELAHGITCKRFGGTVHDLGFMLLYLQPTMYCNVSDAWLFPEKSKRLWVTFAGAYFELVLWALATLVWRVTEPDNAIHFTALVVMVTSGIKTLFNLNPLIKLDGYYLLSDWLEVPNLRQKAFAFLKHWSTTVTPRERRIYLIYGLLAATYSYFLLGWLLVWLAGSLTRRYQAWGFFGFAGLMAFVFRRSLGKVTSVRPSRKWLAAAPIVIVALYFIPMELKVSGEFKILPAHNADVRTEVEGLIEAIPVAEGDTVRKGDLIAQLADRDYRAESRKLDAEINEKDAKLRLLRAGARVEEIEVARATLGKAQERIKYARQQFDILKGLFDQNLASRKEYAEAEEEVAVRQKELQESEGRLNVLLAGSRPEDIEAIEAEIKRLQAQRLYLEGQLERVRIISPIDGVVTTPKLQEKIGQHVNRGDLIVTVHELQTVRAEIAVPEKEISDVRLGQKVAVKARAFPQSSFTGIVTAIAPVATKPETGSGEKTILVTTQLDNPSLLLKSEMTGNAKIYCGHRRLLDLITRRLTRYLRVEFWSWW